jgi:crotonobetainyl-CoA:carnitine CoA-transferase CaiB-like acyl-CoA transferase
MIEAGAGLSSLMGYPDSGPYRSGVAWADPISGLHAVAATMLALYDREADPQRRARAAESAMIEAMGMMVGDALLAAQVHGRGEPRRGNRSAQFAPQGCYPCAGSDRWLAISVTTDSEWRALGEVAGLGPTLATLTLAERQRQHDAIDVALSAWTRGQTPHAAMRRLQAAGVIATVVSDARDLVEDPHLADRGFWARLSHPDAGTHPTPGTAFRFSRTPVTYRRPAPGLGEHNREVLVGLLGVTPKECADLERRGVIVDQPPA